MKNTILTVVACLLSVVLYASTSCAKIVELGDIEKVLGVKAKGECANPPCPVDVDSLLNKLTHEHSKEQNKRKNINDTKEAIAKSKNSPLVKMEKASMIILNKITAKSNKEIFNLGEVRFFGNISIEVHKCIKSTDPFNENNLMLLTIFDNKIEDDNLSVFHGWVVSANPSLSTLEHPVYEVIPVDCFSE